MHKSFKTALTLVCGKLSFLTMRKERAHLRMLQVCGRNDLSQFHLSSTIGGIASLNHFNVATKDRY